jgi:hypothetical protein
MKSKKLTIAATLALNATSCIYINGPLLEEILNIHADDKSRLAIQTGDKHEVIFRSLKEGEADLRTLAENENLEEAWIYSKGDKTGNEFWFEVGEEQSLSSVRVNPTPFYLAPAVSEIISGSAEWDFNVRMYHIHPASAVKAELGSLDDTKEKFAAKPSCSDFKAHQSIKDHLTKNIPSVQLQDSVVIHSKIKYTYGIDESFFYEVPDEDRERYLDVMCRKARRAVYECGKLECISEAFASLGFRVTYEEFDS